MDQTAQSGAPRASLELDDVWLVDPLADRSGRASIRIAEGRIDRLQWWDRPADPEDRSLPARIVIPGLTELHATFHDPPDGGESLDSLLTAAAHGGFTTVHAIADPETHDGGARRSILQGPTHERASASPLELRCLTAVTDPLDPTGRRLGALRAQAASGRIAGFSAGDRSISDPELLRAALLEAGALGFTIMEWPDEPALTVGAEAHAGVIATMLGLRGAPAAAEAIAISRAIAMLREAVQEATRDTTPRLHLRQLSTEAGLEIIRAAKDEGLPVTCDVSPHHLALHEGWVGGDRRWSWELRQAPMAGPSTMGPFDAAPFDSGTRIMPPLRSRNDALALVEGLRDGTIDALSSGHRPRRSVETEVEYGDVRPGISSLEASLGLLLMLSEAGLVPLERIIRALTIGPSLVFGQRLQGSSFVEGELADLVVIDRAAEWPVTAKTIHSASHHTPLWGRTIRGQVLATIARGHVAYQLPDPPDRR